MGCWLLMVLATVVFGERESSLSAVRSAVAEGDVDVVRVAGGMPDAPGVEGFGQLRIHWRDGLLGHYAEVREARPLSAGRADGSTDVVTVGEVDRLLASQPGLRVEYIRDFSEYSLSASLLGWQLPHRLAWTGLLLLLATLALLIGGPQPWRATRWAWFWILGTAAPIGVFAYLVLAGPTGWSRPPRPDADRLTGGWAFLLCVVVAGVMGAAGQIGS